jgi:putative flavoprotein involved in K+ transport
MVVGAGASGLAVAAALRRRGRTAVVLERDARVGERWASRYDRLHLHTVRRFSGLPYRPLPRAYPRYVSKDLYAGYLADYAGALELDVRTGVTVERIEPDGEGWSLTTGEDAIRARVVVVATGRHNEPNLPRWPGAEAFRGTLLHSDAYRSGSAFAGRRVLVVGLGNSGAEIAADLVEQGAARVAVSVRTPPPITSREIAGIPTQVFGLLLHPFPARLVDGVGAVLRRLGTGNLRPYGLGREAWGPFAARRPPVIDVGFLRELKTGRVDVRPALEALTPEGARFAGGREEAFDAVVAATGFGTGLERLVRVPGVVDERGHPREDAAPPGLFFAGYAETPRGQLFESSRRAPRLAAAVDAYLARRR